MNKAFLGLLTGLLFSISLPAQKKLVIMGSSTAAGTGSSHPDSSWVGRLQKHYRQNTSDGQDTVLYNIAWYGQTTYSQMPDGWVSPIQGRPGIDPNHNVTKALSFSPDAVLINLPSNDVANLYWGQGTYDMSETMNNFRTMKQYLNSNGVPAFFTTTQPRDDMDFTKRQMQRFLLDSIYNNFGTSVVDFWNPIVTTDNQYKIIPSLKADEIHVNNTGHRLLFEQARTKNYFGSPATPPPTTPFNLLVEAENFIQSSGIQTEGCNDLGGGQNVGYIDNGDWMEYSINLPSAGNYDIQFRVATPMSGAQLTVRNASLTALGTANLPVTGGWQTWQTLTISLSLPAGSQTLRIQSSSVANWNINWIRFTASSSTPPPPPPPPPSSSTTKIEAENWTAMQGVQLEGTADAGGGQNVGWIDIGDWMDYTITTPAAGSYNLKFRVTSPNSNAKFDVKTSTGLVLATVTVPNTGGWQSWTTTEKVLTLQAGTQVIRLQSLADGYNINWIEINTGGSTPSNAAPVANAGADKTITLPTNEVLVYGSGTDSDGSVIWYKWTQLSGPTTATINNPNDAATVFSNLAQGSYTFRLTVGDNGGATGTDDVVVNVNGSAPSGGSVKIEAENYSSMSGVQTENTGDAGGGQNVGYIDAGDWIEYLINPQNSGQHTLSFRIASQWSGGQFQVRKSDGSVIATVNAVNTGGWQTYTTVSVAVNLSAGAQIIRLVSMNTSSWNINWLQLDYTGTGSFASPDVSNEITDIYPNPIGSQFSFLFNEPEGGTIRLTIVSLDGRIYHKQIIRKEKGAQRISVPSQALPRGSFILNAELNGIRKTATIFKQ